MGMLFIPITSLSLSTLKGQQIGQGAAFTGMMRQLGGSFGIAVITTYMARQNVRHFNDLSQHLGVNDALTQQRIAGMQHTFGAKGMASNTALQSAYASLSHTIGTQASVLSYMDVFMFIGVMFLCCIPIIFFVRSNKKASKVSMGDMH